MRPVRWLAPPRVPPAQVEVCRDSDDNDRNNRIVQLVLSCDTGGKRVWKEARYIRADCCHASKGAYIRVFVSNPRVRQVHALRR